MTGRIPITIDGRPVEVEEGASVAAALLMAGECCRHTGDGEARGPLCGMGICMECRMTIDGVPHRLGCQTLCTRGMEVRTR